MAALISIGITVNVIPIYVKTTNTGLTYRMVYHAATFHLSPLLIMPTNRQKTGKSQVIL